MASTDPCPCSDHHGEGPTVNDLPLPLGLREEWRRLETRRRFLGRVGKTLGWAALATLLGGKLKAGTDGAAPGPNFAPKAKRGIYLFMCGGPPQLDLWDYKPGLAKLFDVDLPDSVRGGIRLSGLTEGQARFPIAPSHWKFRQHGKSGRWVSELLPWTARISDDIATIHTLNTDAVNHEPALELIATGNMVVGKPSLGAWLAYGLGSVNENLPTFVVLTSRLVPGANQQVIFPFLWGSGFLSNRYAGIPLAFGRGPSAVSQRPARHDAADPARPGRSGQPNQSAHLRRARRPGYPGSDQPI